MSVLNAKQYVLKRNYLSIGVLVVIITLFTILESPWAREKRFSDLTEEFKISSFKGVVTGIGHDKNDHNSLKIFYSRHEELDLTWFANKEQLIHSVSVGDVIAKTTNTNKITIYSNGKKNEIRMKIIK